MEEIPQEIEGIQAAGETGVTSAKIETTGRGETGGAEKEKTTLGTEIEIIVEIIETLVAERGRLKITGRRIETGIGDNDILMTKKMITVTDAVPADRRPENAGPTRGGGETKETMVHLDGARRDVELK